MAANSRLLKHFLAGLAYRTKKAVHGAPSTFFTFQAAPGVRTPHQLVHHMSGVMAYALGQFEPCDPRFEAEKTLDAELNRFFRILVRLGQVLDGDPSFDGTSPEQLLQGPFADAMTHAGQLAMLRRLAGAPIPPENFHAAEIVTDNLSSDQAQAVSPDREWVDADGNVQL